MTEVKSLEAARRTGFKGDVSHIEEQCERTSLPQIELEKALTAVFGTDHNVVIVDEPHGLMVDDTWILSSQPVVVTTIGGPRCYGGWVLDVVTHDPGNREEPPSEDYAEVGVVRSWNEIVNLLCVSMVREILDGHFEAQIDYAAMEIPEVDMNDLGSLPILKI